MKSKLSIFLFGALLTSVLMLSFVSCKKEDDSDTVIGKWYIYKDVFKETSLGETYVDEDIYKLSNEVDYFSATIVEFGENTVDTYWNKPAGVTFEKHEGSYELKGKLIITSSIGDKEVEKDTMNYKFENEMLVLWEKGEDEEGTYEHKMYFKRYNGEIPPASWLKPLPVDDFEPDNSFDKATALAVGKTTDFHTTTSDDVDWFKFEAVAGKKYLIQASGYVDGELYLYDTDGSTVLVEDDDNDSEIDVKVSYWGNPVILWECPVSGKYYFAINGYDSEDLGYYKVALSLSNLSIPTDKALPADKKQRKTGFRLF